MDDSLRLFLVHTAGGVASGVLLTTGAALIRDMLERWPYRRVLNLRGDRPVMIVFPDRQMAGRAMTTIQDMSAVEAVTQALAKAGWRPERLRRVEASRFAQIDPFEKDHHQILICSAKSNSVTETFWKALERNGLTYHFWSDPSGEWQIRDGDACRWESPSYRQQAALVAGNKPIMEGPLDDHAILAKLPNPYNPTSKVIIVAGIRGIGTEGAAAFLRDRGKRLRRQIGARDFVAVLGVRYQGHRVVRTRIVHLDLDPLGCASRRP
jgi:hypothetical protein